MNIFCKVSNNEATTDNKSGNEQKEILDSISDQDLQRLYAVEFKSQSYSSFYNTAMEKDKSILTLSVAGIGFLITLLKLAEDLGYYDMLFFSLAAISFLVSVYCIIDMFGKNADFIIDMAQEKDVTLKQFKLKRLDTWAIRSFYLAIVMSLCLGVSTSTSLFLKGEKHMTKERKVNINSGVKDCNESFQQAQTLIKSFEGATNLQPQANTSQNTQQNSNQTTGAAAMMPKTTIDKK